MDSKRVGWCGVVWVCGVWMLGAVLPSVSWAQTAAAEERGAPGVVNLNTASAEELERLPGIGPSRARAILELRDKLERFDRVEQLLRVKGIGRATFRRLRPHLTVEGPTTLRGAPAPAGSGSAARLPALDLAALGVGPSRKQRSGVPQAGQQGRDARALQLERDTVRDHD